ncbi:BCCT family transporter [Vallitalea guaymasensis]|uniref:BCCT family transporter n=1 Tax=Vallitalea guaymasensis TaxID=1185412 RepID=A0A8J8SAN1_9FIRM|nr:BCCT family transporter [Vallitalea guaymasensis]QUH27759.1 BCCT family transporter [Vallitalea guaymasensis]
MEKKDLSKQLYSRNFKKWGFDMNLFVSIVSAILVLGFIIFTIAKPTLSAETFSGINDSLNKNFNWLYVLTINLSFIFLLVVGISKLGRIRLGGFNAKPEYSNFSWYAMLFSAGIGIGIFFYGVAEPIYHLDIPQELQSGSTYDNFKMMFMHWGAHAWALYGLVAVGLGYFAYNKKLPFSFRSLFYPLIKDKIFGIWGDIIDTFAVLAVLFGLATSLGLGANQINSGMNYVFGIPINSTVQIILIVVITFIATLSVVSGISKGIKLLSQANTIISGVLLVAILLIGPTVYILSTYMSSIGLYIKEFFHVGFFTATTPDGVAWQGSWTVFYWAWWISWTPFVGTFIARISKGRTIREIAIGTVALPTIIITIAMTILGASGVYTNTLYDGVIKKAIDSNIATAMFEMFKYLIESPALQMVFSFVAIIAIVLFFVTSSDSGSLVVDNLTSGGKQDSPKTQRVFWALMEGLIALSVLLLGGEDALKTIQSAVVITGLPFAILLIIMMYSLSKELKKSYKKHEYNTILKLKRRMDKLDDDVDYK